MEETGNALALSTNTDKSNFVLLIILWIAYFLKMLFRPSCLDSTFITFSSYMFALESKNLFSVVIC